jgi:hypothetical protein
MDNSHALMWFSRLLEGMSWQKVQESGFINLYYGDMKMPTDFIQTRQLIMLFYADEVNLEFLIPEISKQLTLSAIYITHGLCRVVFQVPEKWNNYYDKILQGKFSEIPQDFFVREMSSDEYSVVRNISRKTSSGKAFAEQFYGVQIPDEATEYWSKVSKKNFIA